MVWYQANVDAIESFPPYSASIEFTAGSRSESEAPCTPRRPNSCTGVVATTYPRDSRLRVVNAHSSMRRTPHRSASAPVKGLSANETTPAIALSSPMAAMEIPRCLA